MIDFSFYYVYKQCCCFIFDIFTTTTTTNFLLYYCLRSNSLMTCRSIGKESRNEIACWIPNVNFTALAAGLLLYFFILLKKIAKSYLFRSQSTWAYIIWVDGKWILSFDMLNFSCKMKVVLKSWNVYLTLVLVLELEDKIRLSILQITICCTLRLRV